MNPSNPFYNLIDKNNLFYNQTPTRELPNGGGSYSIPSSIPGSQLFSPPSTTTKTSTPSTIFGQQTPTPSPKKSKYINPATGTYYTPEEYANSVALKIPAGKGTGDVTQYAGDALANPDESTTALNARATNMNNTRNDIATGTTDPYKVGKDSGIAYSPQELAAIEKAYAGIYDPALNDVFARLKTREEEDKAKRDRESKLELMAIQHGYDKELKSMGGSGSGLEGPSSYQEWVLAGEKEGTGQTYAEYLKGAPEGSSFKSETAITGRQAVSNMLEIAEKNPGIFGRTAGLDIGDWARSDAFRNYRAQLDTLKGNIIPAALTAMREASKTGGALGQVSDREGAWLGASLGALDMTQSPEQIVSQLKQIDASLARWEDAVNKYGGEKLPSETLPQTMILNGQTLYLQSDGTYE